MRNLVIFSAALALSACSSTPVAHSQSQAVRPAQIFAPELQIESSDRTVPVLLIRDGGPMGYFFGAIVVIDGTNAVVLKPEQRFEIYLAPGDHVFSVRPAMAPLSKPMAETTVAIRPTGPKSINLRMVNANGPRLTWSLQAKD